MATNTTTSSMTGTTAPASSTTAAGTAPAPASTTSTPLSFHTASLYVGDIHPEVTEALLFEIFNAVGPVASIRVCRDAVTRRSLGYAYVNFHNAADAERALDTMNYTSIKGVPCRIMWSQRDPTLRKSGVGNIFVNNLSVEVDNKALYDTFSLFGNILSCKVVNDVQGNSKGYGYVHYETQEAAEEAIEKINGMLIAGQEVFVGQFQKRQERGDEAVFTNCFIKNIPKHWTEAELRKEFEPFGAITSCVVTMKSLKAEGSSSSDGDNAAEAASAPSATGFGFVNFESPEAALAAVEALNGRSFPSDNEGGAEIELYVSKAQKKSDRERELRIKFDALKTERMNKYQGVNLYVKNLDDQMSDDELREVFALHGTITSARIMRDPATGQSRGFGFVCYSTPEESTKAVTEMNGKLLRGKPVYVALAQRKEVRRAQLEAQHAQRQAGMLPHHHPLAHPHPALGLPPSMVPPPFAALRPMHQMPHHHPMAPPLYGSAAAPMFYAQPNQNPSSGSSSSQQQPSAGGVFPGGRGFPYPPPSQQGPRGVPGRPGGFPRGSPFPGFQGPPPQNSPQQAAYGRRNPVVGGPNSAVVGGRRGAPRPSMRQQQQPPPNATTNFKYTANARNQPPGGAALGEGGPAAAASSSALSAAYHPSMPLTPAALANASPEAQKNMIGERLYPMIHAEQPELAGKITGMLLEMDNGELLHLLESPEALTSKIQEALQVLEQHAEPSEETNA